MNRLSEEIEKSIEYEEAKYVLRGKVNGHRYKFEKASKHNFLCPKCGESLEHHDNSIIIRELFERKSRCSISLQNQM